MESPIRLLHEGMLFLIQRFVAARGKKLQEALCFYNGRLTSPLVDEMKELSPGLKEPMICSVHPGPVSPDGAASKQAQALALREKRPTLCHGIMRQRFDLSPLIVANFPQLYLEIITGHPIQAILFRNPPPPARWRYSCFLWATSTMC